MIAAYYYIRSIAIKVSFPLAISNLEKLFQRLKDFPIARYEQQQNEFLTLFLQIISMINVESNNEEIQSFIQLFRTLMIKNFNQVHFIQMIAIIMFTSHRTLGLLPRSSSSKQPDVQFDFIIQVFILILEQCLEAIQVPLSMMIIDEQHILPILYLSFTYLANAQKYKADLFEHQVFQQKQTMWNALAKLLRSFGVYATNLEPPKGNYRQDQTIYISSNLAFRWKLCLYFRALITYVRSTSYFIFFSLDKNTSMESLFIKYSDYPLTEERTLECFTPLNDILKPYNFKKYHDDECLSEKDERQLRKLRLVSILRTLCQKIDEKTKKKVFDYLITYVKDDLVCFESPSSTIQQIPSSSFGVPGDRRTTQVGCSNQCYSISKDFLCVEIHHKG